MTSKPCPGCGKEAPKSYHGRSLPWRDEMEVCHDCKTLLEEARTRRKILSEDTETVIIAVPKETWTHWYPQFYMGLASGQDHEGTREELEMCLIRLIHAASELRLQREYARGDFNLWTPPLPDGLTRPQGTSEERIMPRLVAEAIRDLYLAISEALKETNQLSLEEGSQLLLSLASGRLTMDDFNQAALRKRK